MGIGSRDSSARDCSFAHCATRALNLTMPYKGNVVLQKVDSMDALLRFWNSPEYQEAKKLREGFIKSNFIIAIEATD